MRARALAASWPGDAGTTGLRLFAAQVRESARDNAVAYVLVAGLFAVTLLASIARGDDFLPLVAVYASRVGHAALIVIPVVVAFLMIRSNVRGRASSLGALREHTRDCVESGLAAKVLLASAALIAFMAAFLFNKMLIPEVVPFKWDATFAELDLMLFGGVHPWELLHPVLGFPPVTLFIDMMYSVWVVLMVMFWVGAAIPRASSALGRQYILATALTWTVVGLVMATLLSSAGPCYYALVAPNAPDPFAGLNAYLDTVSQTYPLSSSWMKDYLWQIHTGQIDEAGGISAMPSMHNAQAVLFAAFAYRLNRAFGHLMAVYAAVIFVGSIHLGWHYAVDGIVGAAGALAIWQAAGIIVGLPRQETGTNGEKGRSDRECRDTHPQA